jgi:hypothetical protein
MASSAPIRPPPHSHVFWNATRARNFARAVSGNPARRGTYDENIRLLDIVYAAALGRPDDIDPQTFIKKVNPLAFAYTVGLSRTQTKKLLAGAYYILWQRIAASKCACCRELAQKM